MTPEIRLKKDTLSIAYKYAVGMAFKYLREENQEKYDYWSARAREIDYEASLYASNTQSGPIELSQQTKDRWLEFANQEQEYREHLALRKKANQAEELISMGLAKNSLFRQSIIKASAVMVEAK